MSKTQHLELELSLRCKEEPCPQRISRATGSHIENTLEVEVEPGGSVKDGEGDTTRD